MAGSVFLLPGPCQAMRTANMKIAVCGKIKRELFVEPAKTKAKKEEKQKVVQEFIAVINAVLNKGQGLICIHSEDACFLDKFQEQVDNQLNLMITDGSLFDDNYDRTYGFHGNAFRVVYRVRPRTRHPPPINLDYDTKASLDKGLAELSHKQFVTFVKKVSGAATPEQNNTSESDGLNGSAATDTWNRELTFTQDKEVQFFTENRHTQAKGFPPTFYNKDNVGGKLVDYIWEHLFKYISAFSKNEKGGSVWYGIKEEKKCNSKPEWIQIPSVQGVEIRNKDWKLWKKPQLGFYAVSKDIPRVLAEESPDYRCWGHIPSNDIPGVVTVTGSNLKLWEDVKSCIYHIARDTDVPGMSEVPTGKFMCKGVPLNPDQRETLKRELLKRVDESLLWVSTQPLVDPVEVVFHDLKRDNLCVIEIKVKHFHGIVFTSAKGPTSYTINTNTSPPSLVPMHRETWVRAMSGNCEFKIRNNPEIIQ